MKQSLLNRAVALATGEALATIRNRGFGLVVTPNGSITSIGALTKMMDSPEAARAISGRPAPLCTSLGSAP